LAGGHHRPAEHRLGGAAAARRRHRHTSELSDPAS
jgi:hypothetical protein